MNETPTQKDCRKANALMTRYLDGCLNDRDALWLNGHILNCDVCLADFLAYDEMLKCFAEPEVILAPEGFEEAVAAKIAVCGKSYSTRSALVDKVSSAAWTVASLVLGMGLLSAVLSEQLLAFCATGGILADYAAFLMPFAQAVQEAVAMFIGTATTVFAFCEQFIEGNGAWLALAIGFVCIAVSVFLKDRDAARSGAEINTNEVA